MGVQKGFAFAPPRRAIRKTRLPGRHHRPMGRPYSMRRGSRVCIPPTPTASQEGQGGGATLPLILMTAHLTDLSEKVGTHNM